MSIAFILIYLLFVLGVFEAVEGRVITVPDNAPTIQVGLDSLNNGDTLYIRRGTYQEILLAPQLQFVIIGEFSPDSGNLGRPLIDVTALQMPDTTPILRLPSQSNATIESIHFKNVARRGIVSVGLSADLTNCVLDSTNIGIRFVQDNVGATITIRDCQFWSNYEHCIGMNRGNSLIAKNCIFAGAGSPFGRALISVGESIIDSCSFWSEIPIGLLFCYQGPHEITNCTFGPVTAPVSEPVVLLGGGAIEFRNNSFVDCSFFQHVLSVQSTEADSVEVCDNRFSRCDAYDSTFLAQGVLSVSTQGEMQRGALICGNEFRECFGNSAVDDIILEPGVPSLLERNSFIRDSINGLPSVFAGNPIWQPTPVTLRDNVWENCGYAVELSAAADARFNYWGHSSGPYHEIDNPLGLGDTITGPVPFIPWLEDTIEAVEQPLVELVNELTVQIYPNPFNSTITIEYALIREQDVTLEIYDVRTPRRWSSFGEMECRQLRIRIVLCQAVNSDQRIPSRQASADEMTRSFKIKVKQPAYLVRAALL
ncbi:hypothetical protein HUU59_11550 [bacterium]|nr:hypothetical protein [bacterium]